MVYVEVVRFCDPIRAQNTSFTDLKTNKNFFGYLDSVLAIVKYFICDNSVLVERNKWFSREYDVLFIAITLVINARSWKL